MAKIRTRVKELLRDLQQRGNDGAAARGERIAALQGEIGRLTDAVAQMGLSPALRARLVAAESELASLSIEKSADQTSAVASDDGQVSAGIRRVALSLEKALASDVEVARRILGERLGDIRVDETDDGIYAQIDIGPVLLEAVGADVSRSGCGGKI